MLTDQMLYDAGFTRVLLNQTSDTPPRTFFRGDYLGRQTVGWEFAASTENVLDVCPTLIADILAPRPFGVPQRSWPQMQFNAIPVSGGFGAVVYVNLDEPSLAKLDRHLLGAYASGEQTDLEVRRRYEGNVARSSASMLSPEQARTMDPNKRQQGVLDLDHIFTYHAPSEDQQRRYLLLRDMAKSFAATILSCTPAGPDQSTAIRKLREAVMTANAAIALEKAP